MKVEDSSEETEARMDRIRIDHSILLVAVFVLAVPCDVCAREDLAPRA